MKLLLIRYGQPKAEAISRKTTYTGLEGRDISRLFGGLERPRPRANQTNPRLKRGSLSFEELEFVNVRCAQPRSQLSNASEERRLPVPQARNHDQRSWVFFLVSPRECLPVAGLKPTLQRPVQTLPRRDRRTKSFVRPYGRSLRSIIIL